MTSLAANADIRIAGARIVEEALVVDLIDGRSISAPLSWFPRLAKAEPEARQRFEIAGAGYGLHWPELDEDISVEGLLRGAPSPESRSPCL
ncbi:DUF2442 domain-containing protein [Alkalicaulis satelles]|uniref:DUF2442 domain-containing protein n=1 Tax=Alkalicaulis satelles TaxID=2609175 RepID=A0A5M6ZLK0_9PROT|nr:DUF2442 domain-containing protein [Alkalicaulis satelles]KAA5804815.1 DUF2442 domain-containing protein [Alkalicaulis satelles]